MHLWRVCTWHPGAKPFEPGHPTYVPALQGQGRVDNPDHYRVTYLAESPIAAVGEAFGRVAEWSAAMLEGRKHMANSGKALARFEFVGTPLDLDNPDVLSARELRPSRVVTRERSVTQRWALRIWQEDAWPGVRWWSALDADWGIVALWEQRDLRVTDVDVLTIDHPVVLEAADHLGADIV